MYLQLVSPLDVALIHPSHSERTDAIAIRRWPTWPANKSHLVCASQASQWNKRHAEGLLCASITVSYKQQYILLLNPSFQVQVAHICWPGKNVSWSSCMQTYDSIWMWRSCHDNRQSVLTYCASANDGSEGLYSWPRPPRENGWLRSTVALKIAGWV